MPAGFDAIVLAGGAARRLAGVDKPMLDVGGRPILRSVLDAVCDARRRIVVGAVRDAIDDVIWCREDPPGAGPRAALATALPFVESDYVILLGADLPAIAPAIAVLLATVRDEPLIDAAALVDADGHVNFVAAAWRTDALRRAGVLAEESLSLRSVYAAATVHPVPDPHGWGADCDTPEDLEAARRKARTCMSELQDWVDELARTLDLDAAAVDVALLLDVARDAAHQVARPAAPITTFLVGLAAGRAGGDAAAIRAAAGTATRLALARAVPDSGEDG